jgi:hypothetical protein
MKLLASFVGGFDSPEIFRNLLNQSRIPGHGSIEITADTYRHLRIEEMPCLFLIAN